MRPITPQQNTKMRLRTRLLAAVLGSVIYRAICALVLQIGLDANYMKLFTALFITAAISVPALKKARGK